MNGSDRFCQLAVSTDKIEIPKYYVGKRQLFVIPIKNFLHMRTVPIYTANHSHS